MNRNKNKLINKEEIENKLSSIAAKVADRGVFIISKHNDSFAVEEYISKKTIITSIPTLSAAERICNLYNSKRPLSIQRRILLETLTSAYYKLSTEIVHIKNCIKSHKEAAIVDILTAKLSNSSRKLTHIKHQLDRV